MESPHVAHGLPHLFRAAHLDQGPSPRLLLIHAGAQMLVHMHQDDAVQFFF